MWIIYRFFHFLLYFRLEDTIIFSENSPAFSQIWRCQVENSQFNCSEVYIRRLRRQLIRDIFYRVPLCGSTAEEVNDYYCYHLLPMAYQIIILRVIPKGYAQGAPSPELLSRVEARMKERLSPVFQELETAVLEGRVVCLFNITTHRDSPGTDQFKLSIGRFFAELSTSGSFENCEFVMAEGVPAESIAQLDHCLQSALQAMEYGVIYGLNRRYDSYELVEGWGNILSILTATRKNQLRHRVETLNLEELSALISDILQDSRSEVVKNPGLAYRLPHTVLSLVASAISDSIPTTPEFSALLASRQQQIDDCLSLDQLQQLTIDGALALCAYYRQHMPSGSSPAILAAKAYLLEHYREKVYLSQVGDYVQLNPQYLSVLFKRETGQSITDYLTSLRMEQAKTALRSGNATIQEIADMVGYPDAHYFSRVFKRTMGVTPGEYRNG